MKIRRKSFEGRSMFQTWVLASFFIILLFLPISPSCANANDNNNDNDANAETNTDTSNNNGDNSNDEVCMDDGSRTTTTNNNNIPKHVNEDDNDDDNHNPVKMSDYTELGVEQATGQGSIPDELVQKVQQVIDSHPIYYDQLKQDDRYRLAASTCINKNPLCSYWVVQGQCINQEYQGYMENECPLACRLCDTEEKQARAFLDFLYSDLPEALDQIAHSTSSTTPQNMVQDRHRVLSIVMMVLDMDPMLLQRPMQAEDGNWMEVLHQRIMALIPPSMLQIHTDPLEKEKAEAYLMENLHLPPEMALFSSQYRHRGHILTILAQPMEELIVRPIQLGISFAIPNFKALAAISALQMPVLEMGAGSGYWTSLLRQSGTAAKAFDLQGTGPEHKFYDHFYANDIQTGTCDQVLADDPGLATSHALLLIWPNDPDPIDHPQYTAGDDENKDSQASQPVWDAACLRAFVQAGGTHVIYVGERLHVIRDKFPDSNDSGISSTRELQSLLTEKFDLITTVPLPTLWLNEDDLTIWKLKD